jgi:hypothetical protein
VLPDVIAARDTLLDEDETFLYVGVSLAFIGLNQMPNGWFHTFLNRVGFSE